MQLNSLIKFNIIIKKFPTIQKNIKVMYKELLDEAGNAKKIKIKLEDSSEIIIELKKQLKAKKDLVNYCKT